MSHKAPLAYSRSNAWNSRRNCGAHCVVSDGTPAHHAWHLASICGSIGVKCVLDGRRGRPMACSATLAMLSRTCMMREGSGAMGDSANHLIVVRKYMFRSSSLRECRHGVKYLHVNEA